MFRSQLNIAAGPLTKVISTFEILRFDQRQHDHSTDRGFKEKYHYSYALVHRNEKRGRSPSHFLQSFSLLASRVHGNSVSWEQMMNKPYRLGLDVGINSLGWAILDLDQHNQVCRVKRHLNDLAHVKPICRRLNQYFLTRHERVI